MSVTLNTPTVTAGQIQLTWTPSPDLVPYEGNIIYRIYASNTSLSTYNTTTIQSLTAAGVIVDVTLLTFPLSAGTYFRVLAEWQSGVGQSFPDGDGGMIPGNPIYSKALSNEQSVSGGNTGSNTGGVVCFLGNAPVLTPSGYKRIDSLAVGDMVRTADGRDVAIQRVKHQRVVAPSASVNPYVIPAGQFGATQNLAISPRHAVAVPGRGMVEARELGLRQLSMKAAFDYYNLELPEWDNMVVAGVEVESLAPKKRVVMTAAQFREMVGSRSVDLAKLARIASVRADGSVDVMLTRKTRRM